ncbi:MAG: ferritin-like domain-containing protein, partial [Streptosporangiaceae bacterium]
LYRSIEAGFEHLTAKYGERWLFVGPPRAQATQEHFGWPELVPVTGLASAKHAIEQILEQGEGPRGEWRNAHFGQFVAILDEYEQMIAADPAFDPVRPVIAANVRPATPPAQLPLITDQQTARITDLFNVGYEIMLQIFERFFAHTEETDPQLKALADTTIALMFQVIEPLANLITTLPAGPGYPGQTAGPSFELFYETDYLMPHREAAWSLLAERLDQGRDPVHGDPRRLRSQHAAPARPRRRRTHQARRCAGHPPPGHQPTGSARPRRRASFRPGK